MTVQRDKGDEKIANDVPEGKQTPADHSKIPEGKLKIAEKWW